MMASFQLPSPTALKSGTGSVQVTRKSAVSSGQSTSLREHQANVAQSPFQYVITSRNYSLPEVTLGRVDGCDARDIILELLGEVPACAVDPALEELVAGEINIGGHIDEVSILAGLYRSKLSRTVQ